MKKSILIIIGAFSLFAIQLASAECHPNTWYNGQIVTYCEGNNANDAYYYSVINAPTYYPYDNNYYTNYNNNYDSYGYSSSYYPYNGYSNTFYNNNNNSYDSNNVSYDSNYDYCDHNYCDLGNRTYEENYYNLLYLNNLGGPGTTTAPKADYFKDNVIGKDKELGMVDAIRLKNFTFRYASNTTKYTGAKIYIDVFKEKIKDYYIRGKISYNKMYTVINDLDDLVYNLNGQFTNTKVYDSTGNKMYKEVATEYATEVRTSYDRLKFSLETYK